MWKIAWKINYKFVYPNHPKQVKAQKVVNPLILLWTIQIMY